jgi:hypothetical protein
MAMRHRLKLLSVCVLLRLRSCILAFVVPSQPLAVPVSGAVGAARHAGGARLPTVTQTQQHQHGSALLARLYDGDGDEDRDKVSAARRVHDHILRADWSAQYLVVSVVV